MQGALWPYTRWQLMVPVARWTTHDLSVSINCPKSEQQTSVLLSYHTTIQALQSDDAPHLAID